MNGDEILHTLHEAAKSEHKPHVDVAAQVMAALQAREVVSPNTKPVALLQLAWVAACAAVACIPTTIWALSVMQALDHPLSLVFLTTLETVW